MPKHPLLCATCGRVLGWARKANQMKLPCPQCHRYTEFTVTEGKVSKADAPPPKKQKARVVPKREQLADLMARNHYIDHWKC